jgi:competence protein ComEC
VIGQAEVWGAPGQAPGRPGRIARPLLPLAAAFVAGIALADALALPGWSLLGALLLLLAAAGILLALGALRAATVVLCGLFLALGGWNLVRATLPGPDSIARLPAELRGTPLGVEGIVAAPPEWLGHDPLGRSEGGRLRLLLDVRAVEVGGAWRPATGTVRLVIREAASAPAYGGRLRGPIRLRAPRGFLNPAGYDWRRAAAIQGIDLEGWAPDDAAFAHLGGGEGNPIVARVYALRARMLGALDRALPPEQAALLKAIVLGDRGGLTREVNDAFLASGTYHILAISGLNISLLAGTVFLGLRLLAVPRRASAVACMALVSLYAGLAGASASVVRAAIMADTYLAAIVLDRDSDVENALAIAGLVILGWNPLALWDVGFQLTFAATLGIVLAARGWHFPGLPRPARWLIDSLVVSLAATLATLPILAVHFNRVSLVGVLANVPIVPLSGALTAIGMGYASLLLAVPAGLGAIAGLLGLLLDLTLAVARWFAAFPFALVRLFTPSAAMVACFYVALLAAFEARRRPWARGVAAGGAVGLAWLVAGALGAWGGAGPFRATLVDVGQGEAILVELPGPRRLLVDAGGLPGSRFDVGERVVAPVLWWRWVPRLDVVILTHPQADHGGGLPAILRLFPVGEVWEPGLASNDPAYVWLQEALRLWRIPHKILESGHVWRGGQGAEVRVLHPSRPHLPGGRREGDAINRNSLVAHVRVGAQSLLLTGDIDTLAEQHLLANGLPVRATVLKVPHHGSRGSSSEAFLAAVRPEAAVVSAGFQNRHRHPHRETLARYAAAGIPLYRTDLHGAITIELSGPRVIVTPYARPAINDP